MVLMDEHEHSLRFTWILILNSVSGHSSPCCGATCGSFLAAFASLQFSQPKCRNRKCTEIGGKNTEIGGKNTEICGKNTEICGTFAWGNAHLLSLVNCTPSNGFFWPMSMTISSARAGAEREILVEKIVECFCVLR